MHARATQPLGGGRADAREDGHVHRTEQVLLGPRWHHDESVGLSRSLAILAMNFEVPIPTLASEAAGGVVHPRAERFGESGDRGYVELREVAGGQVDEGLVE